MPAMTLRMKLVNTENKHTDLMKDTAIPSLVRLRRVDYYLNQNEKYNVNPDQTQTYEGKDNVKFLKRTFTVACGIAAAGLDSCAMKKKEVWAWADHFLFKAPQPGPTQPATESEPARVVAEQVSTSASKVDATMPAGIPIKPRIAIYTLLLSARSLTPIDKEPDSEKLGQLIDIAAKAYLETLMAKQKLAAAKEPEPAVTTAPAPEPEPVESESLVETETPTGVAETAPAQPPVPIPAPV
jgi:hypothetical protein